MVNQANLTSLWVIPNPNVIKETYAAVNVGLEITFNRLPFLTSIDQTKTSQFSRDVLTFTVQPHLHWNPMMYFSDYFFI